MRKARRRKVRCASCGIRLPLGVVRTCTFCTERPLAIKGVCGMCGCWIEDQSIENYVERGNFCGVCDAKMDKAVDSESKIEMVLRNFTF